VARNYYVYADVVAVTGSQSTKTFVYSKRKHRARGFISILGGFVPTSREKRGSAQYEPDLNLGKFKGVS
jgi:hypothetical protein